MPASFTISSVIHVYNSAEELTSDDRNLLAHAKQILINAYAPYSKFKVGAAILLSNGKIISGTNQENAAYPSGMCAERSALFYARSQFPNEKITAIAIAFESEGKFNEEPLSPCGACRQALAEYEFKDGDIRVVMSSSKNQVYIAPHIKSLLPLAFNSNHLK